MKLALVVMTLILSTSCTTVRNSKIKNDIAKRLFDIFDRTTSGISDGQIASVADRRPQLPKPFELAVYFKQPGEKENWRWSSQDKAEVLSAIEKNRGTVKRAFELINTGSKEEDVKGIRLMAAQQGADAVLVIQGAGEVKSDANGLAATYIALVPMLFVNGNNVKSGFVTQAVLWDVRSEFVHMGLQSEGDWTMKRPLAFRQKDRALDKAKEESIDQLEKKLSSLKLNSKI